MQYESVHFGQLVREKLKEKGISARQLAKICGYKTGRVFYLLKRPEVETNVVRDVSNALKEDFFFYLLSLETREKYHIGLTPGIG